MHETGLCDAIVQAVLHQAEGRRVTTVRVRVGGHVGGHEIDPAVIDQGFRVAASGTPAQDADVEVVIEPLSVRCRGCGGQGAATDALSLVACPRCGGVDIEVTGGAEVELEAITFAQGGGELLVDQPSEQSREHCVHSHSGGPKGGCGDDGGAT
jgi:hydrogenase nickel incorporation protein HypA/HybF